MQAPRKCQQANRSVRVTPRHSLVNHVRRWTTVLHAFSWKRPARHSAYESTSACILIGVRASNTHTTHVHICAAHTYESARILRTVPSRTHSLASTSVKFRFLLNAVHHCFACSIAAHVTFVYCSPAPPTVSAVDPFVPVVFITAAPVKPPLVPRARA